MQELEAEGVVEKRGTAGTFVTMAMAGDGNTRPAWQLLRDAGKQRQAELESIDTDGAVEVQSSVPAIPYDWVRGLAFTEDEPIVLMGAPRGVSRALQLQPDELVLRMRYILGNIDLDPPSGIVETYYPGQLFVDAVRLGPDRQIILDRLIVESWLNRQDAKRVRRVIDDVEVRAPRADERREFGMLLVDAMISVERKVLDQDENVLEVTYIVTPASRVRLRHVYEIKGDAERNGHEAAPEVTQMEE
jgi:DNA-binding GntR family transcriptional regulator